VPHTSTKHPTEAPPAVSGTLQASASVAVERARQRVREGYYDRPEVRRTLAALLLRRAARGELIAKVSGPKSA
jgi:hypothetical protein